MIQRGDIVEIVPQLWDEGNQNFVWIATSDGERGGSTSAPSLPASRSNRVRPFEPTGCERSEKSVQLAEPLRACPSLAVKICGAFAAATHRLN